MSRIDEAVKEYSRQFDSLMLLLQEQVCMYIYSVYMYVCIVFLHLQLYLPSLLLL